MSKIAEKLEKLENKIDGLSKQLRTTKKAIFDANKVVLDKVADFHKLTGKLATETALISEGSRMVRGGLERRAGQRMFYRGLIMGLFLGIIGNIFVSYLIEFLKGFILSFWVWGLGAVVAYLCVLLLIVLLGRESRRRPE